MLEKIGVFGQNLIMRKSNRKRPPMESHQWIDEVDLKMCRRIATKVRRDPSLMRIPKGNLRRWKVKLGHWPVALREWDKIIRTNSLPQVLEILTQDNDEGQRLRQSDPFVGILSEKERRSFFKT